MKAHFRAYIGGHAREEEDGSRMEGVHFSNIQNRHILHEIDMLAKIRILRHNAVENDLSKAFSVFFLNPPFFGMVVDNSRKKKKGIGNLPTRPSW